LPNYQALNSIPTLATEFKGAKDSWSKGLQNKKKYVHINGKRGILLGNLAAETLTARKYLIPTAIFNNKNLLDTAPKKNVKGPGQWQRGPLGILQDEECDKWGPGMEWSAGHSKVHTKCSGA